MTDSSIPLPPAGWYRDPAGGAAPRWWNGSTWAEPNTVPADATPLPTAASTPAATPTPSTPSVPPVAPLTPVSMAAPASSATPSTPNAGSGAAQGYGYAAPTAATTAETNTWQIWALALLPLFTIPFLFTIDISVFFPAPGEDPLSAQLRQYTDPGYLITSAAGWLLYGLSIPLAIYDRRALLARGIDRPFHWAFAFLGNIVYVIGRSVVVRRRTGQGLAPLWAAIAVQVIGLIASLIFMARVFSLAIEWANTMTYNY